MAYDTVSAPDAALSPADRNLLRMANQIATFFHSMQGGEAVAGVAGHLNSFWTPEMRQRLLAIAAIVPADQLDALVRQALPLVDAPSR